MLLKQKWGSDVLSGPQAHSSLKWGCTFIPIIRSQEWGHVTHLWVLGDTSLLCIWIPLPDCLYCFWNLPQIIPWVPISLSLKAVNYHCLPADNILASSSGIHSPLHNRSLFLSSLSWEVSLLGRPHRWGMWGLSSEVTSLENIHSHRVEGHLSLWTWILPITVRSFHM